MRKELEERWQSTALQDHLHPLHITATALKALSLSLSGSLSAPVSFHGAAILGLCLIIIARDNVAHSPQSRCLHQRGRVQPQLAQQSLAQDNRNNDLQNVANVSKQQQFHQSAADPSLQKPLSHMPRTVSRSPG